MPVMHHPYNFLVGYLMIETKIPADWKPQADCLADKVILVTGATGGYGKAVSLTLSRYGATVILLGKNVKLLENLYDEIEQTGPTPAIYPLNLEGATEKDYFELADNIVQSLGRLDGIFHTAAQLGAPTPFQHSDTENWYRVMQINLNGPYMLTRCCIPLLKQSAHGSIVFMTDDKQGAYWDAYGVSKAALNGLMENLAGEFADSPLHANGFNPGPSKTGLQLRAFPAAANNDQLPEPISYAEWFVYMMSDQLAENGVCFTPKNN